MSYARNVVRRILNRQPDVSPAVEEVLAPLDPPFRERLLSMYRGEPQLGLDGEHHAIDPTVKISPRRECGSTGCACPSNPKRLSKSACATASALFFFLPRSQRINPATTPQSTLTCANTGMALALPMSALSAWNPRSATSNNLLSAQASTSPAKAQILMSFSSTEAIALTMRCPTFPLCASLRNGREHDLRRYVDAQYPDRRRLCPRESQRFCGDSPPHGNICVFTRVGEDVREWDHFQPFSSAGRRS